MTTRDPTDDTVLLPEPLRVIPDVVKTAAAAAARRPSRVVTRHDIDYAKRPIDDVDSSVESASKT